MTKYIIVRKCGLETAILFFGALSHDQAINRENLARDGAELVSAGFFQVLYGGVSISNAGSTSLNLSSRPQDQAVIQRTLYLMGLARPLAAPKPGAGGSPVTSLVHLHN